MNKLPASSKTAIFGLLALCAAVAVWFLCRPDPLEWRLRTIFHIGTSVSPAAVINGKSDLEGSIERYSSVVALISTPVFRDSIAGTSQLQPDSAALSKRLIYNTLRAHALNDYDIEIEFVAASPADCRAAYRTIAERIERRHAELSEQNAKLMQVAIDDYRERADQLTAWESGRIQNNSAADIKKTELERVWSETRERLHQLKVVQSAMTATTFPPESEIYIEGPLVNNTVRLSALAGLAVILCTVVLGWTLETRSPRARNPDA